MVTPTDTPLPLFIIGSGRSGTTMLRLMLNCHSAIRIPRESWFIINLIDELPGHGPLSDTQRRRAHEIIRTHSRWKDWECDDAVLLSAITEHPQPDLAGLVDAVFRRCSGMGDARRWGDKTPKYSLYARKMAAVFPEAFFIHMIRDARDVYLSMKLARWFGGSARRIGKYWRSTTESAAELRTVCSSRYREVHYEELVKDPEKQLRDICEVLGENFERAMLSFYESAATETAPWEESLHSKTRRAPRYQDLERWRKELSILEILLIESVVYKTMLSVGQKPHFGPAWEPLRIFIRIFFKSIEYFITLKNSDFQQVQKFPSFLLK